ncbi:MAG: DMT family transporter [Thiothrix sp.]|nr:MAG: DMT family transporter [Thiothrix sp.]
MTMTNNSSVLRGLLISLLGYAVFSVHDALVKVLNDYSVFQIIFFAMLFSYLPFSLVRLADARALSLRPVHPWLVFLRAALMVGALCFAFMAFSMLPLVQVYVLLFTTPVLISLLAVPFLGEKIQLIRAVLIILGLIGVLVVLRPTPQRLELGHLFGALSAFCGAGAAIISRKIGRQEISATLILSPLILNIITSGCLLYFVYKPMPLADLCLMFLLGVLALLGQLSILTGYRNAPAAVVAPMQYSQIIWAIIFGSLFFNEAVDTLTIVGALITITAGILMVWRESRVSVHQPVIRSRNMRSVGSGPIPGFESEN